MSLSNSLVPLGSKDSYTTIKSFVANFVSDDFFIDIININLYPSDFNLVSIQGNSMLSFIRQFFIDLTKMCEKLKLQNIKKIKSNIMVTNTILNIRENGLGVITYDNIFNHLPTVDFTQQQLIQSSIDNRLSSTIEFRKLINQIVNSIQAYYEVNNISASIITFDRFAEYASQPGVSVFEAIKMYKDNVIHLYNDLSNLKTLDKYESEKDYFVIQDKDSTKSLAASLVDFLRTGYSFYRTGFHLIDNNIDGAESSSVHLITAPSNHGKSILLVNLVKNIIIENINDFEENDCVLFITLEDTMQKLVRRFCSVFGNVDASSVKSLYRRAYEALKANEKNSFDNNLANNIEKMIQNLLNSSIYSVTNGKVALVVKHCQENTFSPGDVSKFIDRLKIEGLNVKLAFIDYLDTMAPTVNRYSKFGDYDVQGQITQEMRNISQQYKIPVFMPTQNKRESENVNSSMGNNQVGDSYKKVRYSDFIYMCRQDTTKDAFDPAVRKYVIPDSFNAGDQLSPELLKHQDKINQNLIPFEVKITKSKDGGRDAVRYMLFCTSNLRMYNTLNEYLLDLPKLDKNSKNLQTDINTLTNIATSSVSDDFSMDSIEMDAPFLE